MKHKVIQLLFLSAVLGFTGCNYSTPNSSNSEATLTTIVTDAPNNADRIELPENTETPVAPIVTETPVVTEAPNTTATPNPTATSTPKPTVTPKPTATSAPKLTATPKPTATSTPKPTTTPKPTATPVPSLANGDTITFGSSNLSYYTSYGATLKKQTNDSISLSYQQQYGQIYFKFPYPIQMKDCAYITFKFESEYAPSAIKLMGKDFLKNAFCTELFVDYNLSGDGMVEYTFTPDVLHDVYGIGFMSMKDEVDFSNYDATFYSITFHSEPFILSAETTEPEATNEETLLSTYGSLFEHFGTCTLYNEFLNATDMKFVRTHFNTVTVAELYPINILNYDSPTFLTVDEAKELGYIIPDNYKETVVPQLHFKELDTIIANCAENELSLHFHTLLWSYCTPYWFFYTDYSNDGAYVTPEVMDARLEYYIRNVITHAFQNGGEGVIYAFDVTNEVLHTDYDDPYNNSNQEPVLWHAVYGRNQKEPRHVKLAFQFADDTLRSLGVRNQVSLLMNDYNEETIVDEMIAMASYINSERKLCDGFGLQAHFYTKYPEPAVYIQALEKYLMTGLDVQITELDVGISEGHTEEIQADYYYELMKGILQLRKKYPNFSSLIYWGFRDETSWRKESSPLLFSSIDKPKEVYYKVLQAFKDAN